MSDQSGMNPGASDLDYGLQSRFLGSLDDEQKLRIFDLTTRASRELHRWAARYPLIRRVRVWPLSLSVAAAAPFANAAALVTMARMSLWVFTIDDLFDEETVRYAELRRRVERYNDILNVGTGPLKRERDTLALALLDIRDDLRQYSLFEALHDQWSNAVSRTMDAMMREHDWRIEYRGQGSYLPSYETYREYGLYSIGGPPHIWTTLIAIGDESALDHLDRLTQMERTASLCIRLANDLQSYHKEITEGKINSIVILQREAMTRGYPASIALRHACELVQKEIQQGLADLSTLQQQAQTATGFPERAIADIACFVCDFYIHHDYHTFPTGPGRS